MWPYWLLFLIPATFAVLCLRPITSTALTVRSDRWPAIWKFIYVFLALMVGLRHEVGGDWTQYLEMLDSYSEMSNIDKFGFQDPAFVLMNRLAVWSGEEYI